MGAEVSEEQLEKSHEILNSLKVPKKIIEDLSNHQIVNMAIHIGFKASNSLNLDTTQLMVKATAAKTIDDYKTAFELAGMTPEEITAFKADLKDGEANLVRTASLLDNGMVIHYTSNDFENQIEVYTDGRSPSIEYTEASLEIALEASEKGYDFNKSDNENRLSKVGKYAGLDIKQDSQNLDEENNYRVIKTDWRPNEGFSP